MSDFHESVKKIFCEAYFLMSGADGTLDAKEFNKFAEMVKNAEYYFHSPDVISALNSLYRYDCNRSDNALRRYAFRVVGANPEASRIPLNEIFDVILADFAGFAARLKLIDADRHLVDILYGDLMILLSAIAKASGGFLGIGRVSDEERRAFFAALGAIGLGEEYVDKLLSE